MAKSAGYVVPSEFGDGGTYFDNDSTFYYFYMSEFILMTPFMATHWQDLGDDYLWAILQRCKFYMDWFAADTATNNLEIMFSGDAVQSDIITTANGNGQWGLGAMPYTFPDTAYTPVLPVPGHSLYTSRGPSYTVMRPNRIYETVTGSGPILYSMYIEADGYAAISDVGNDVDKIERTTEADKPYTSYRPLSSWQVSNHISLVDRLMYEARYIQNVPMIEQTTTS